MCYTNNGDDMKTITLDIRSEQDLFETYNDKISKNLIEYLINEAKVKDDIEVNINTKLDIPNIDEIIKRALEDNYVYTKRVDKFYDSKQIRFLIIGLIFLLISTFLGYEILRELGLIVGWFSIYEVIEISINIASTLKNKRKIIRKLLDCEMKINKDKI